MRSNRSHCSSSTESPNLTLLAHHGVAAADRPTLAQGRRRLVRRIADSSILDGEQLDVLARTFIAAADAVYWRVPDDRFAGGEQIVIDVDRDEPDETDDGGPVEVDEGPVVARRDVFPPLRRWAGPPARTGTSRLVRLVAPRRRTRCPKCCCCCGWAAGPSRCPHPRRPGLGRQPGDVLAGPHGTPPRPRAPRRPRRPKGGGTNGSERPERTHPGVGNEPDPVRRTCASCRTGADASPRTARTVDIVLIATATIRTPGPSQPPAR